MKMRHMNGVFKSSIKIFILLFSGMLIKGCYYINYYLASDVSKVWFKSVTTNQYDTGGPINEVVDFKFEAERIHVFTQYRNLNNNQRYFHRTVFYDQDEIILFEFREAFTPANRNHSTWAWYDMQPLIDTPGDWKIEVYLNDTLLDVKTISVSPEHAGLEEKAVNTEIQCPSGYRQVGGLGADIPGCGLESCGQRYGQTAESIQSCADHCNLNSFCNGFNYAPKNGDKNHRGQKVCTIYASSRPTAF